MQNTYPITALYRDLSEQFLKSLFCCYLTAAAVMVWCGGYYTVNNNNDNGNDASDDDEMKECDVNVKRLGRKDFFAILLCTTCLFQMYLYVHIGHYQSPLFSHLFLFPFFYQIERKQREREGQRKRRLTQIHTQKSNLV